MYSKPFIKAFNLEGQEDAVQGHGVEDQDQEVKDQDQKVGDQGQGVDGQGLGVDGQGHLTEGADMIDRLRYQGADQGVVTEEEVGRERKRTLNRLSERSGGT